MSINNVKTVMSTKLNALCVFFTAACGVTQAAPPADRGNKSPAQQAQRAQEQAALQAAYPEYNYDIRPPVLKALTMQDAVDVAFKDAQVAVTITATDNLSGVASARVDLESPSGNQLASGWRDLPFETNRSQFQVAIDMSYASEPGLWRVRSVTLQDANGNSAEYGGQALLQRAAPVTVNVINATGDTLAPAIATGGINLTPTVSRSRPPAGTLPGTAARIGLRLNLVDAGVAGVSSASVTFCLPDGFDCLYLNGSEPVRGKLSSTVVVGGSVNSFQTLGTYRPRSLQVQDFSGNFSSYDSAGGDFRGILDIPEIVVTE